FTFDAGTLVSGLDLGYPRGRKVGGLASGGQQPGGNALWAGGQTHRTGAIAIALNGDIAVDTIVAQGCRPIGVPMPVTRCQRNLLLEIGGKKPTDVLRELFESLDERDQGLFRHSLFIGLEMNADAVEYRSGDFLVRNLVGVDPDSGALAIGALVAE